MIAADPLTIEGIRRQLKSENAERHLYLFAEVTSTNSCLCDLARRGARDGSVVIADTQRAGRGRRGQRWFSPPGVNLYASVLSRPDITARELTPFSFIASLALSDAIDALGVAATIKWPNDVLVDGKKVAGALVECGMRGEHVEYVILGIGVNVNVSRDALEAALGPAAGFATSLNAALGHEVDRNVLLAAWLDRLDAWLLTWTREGEMAIRRAWADRDILTGRRVEVRGNGPAFEGRVLGVAATGHLVVEDSLGQLHHLTNEEVRLS